MATIAYDAHIAQLLDVAERLERLFRAAAVHYRIVGGLAVFLHVRDRDPLAARTTRDRMWPCIGKTSTRSAEYLQRRASSFRHAASVDMLADRTTPQARSAVHFVFLNEKVRPDYLEPVPAMEGALQTEDGLLLVRVEDLVHMKLTSFRLKDQVHIQDMDAVGSITADIEQSLRPPWPNASPTFVRSVKNLLRRQHVVDRGDAPLSVDALHREAGEHAALGLAACAGDNVGPVGQRRPRLENARGRL
ncbi:MAG: hypothetical protein R2748_09635 [Bryobacterales bacterium]